jgi:hypothetical protein
MIPTGIRDHAGAINDLGVLYLNRAGQPCDLEVK